MSNVIAVVATARARAGRSADLEAAVHALVAPTRAEQGCLTYELHRSLTDPDVWVFYEVWASQETFDLHLASGPLTAFLAQVPDLVEGGLDVQTLTPLTRGD